MAAVITPVIEEYAGGTIAREQVGLWRDGFRRLRRNRLALARPDLSDRPAAHRDHRDLLDPLSTPRRSCPTRSPISRRRRSTCSAPTTSDGTF